MTDDPEWITAAEAKALVEKHGIVDAKKAIAERAAAGMIKSHASAYYKRKYDSPSPAYIPTDFWKAYITEGKSFENWSTGDFEVRTPELRTPRALGVKFRLADIRSSFGLLDTTPQLKAVETLELPRSKGGRPPSQWWDDLWIEVCCQIYGGRLTPQSQADIEKAMLQWLADHKLDASEATIKPRARKLFYALKNEGKNIE